MGSFVSAQRDWAGSSTMGNSLGFRRRENISCSTGRVVSKQVTEFVSAFRSAYANRAETSNPDIVEFSCRSPSKEFVPITPSGNYKYLIQEQYYHLWQLCEERFLHGLDRETRSQTVIVGTSGIGKSAARLLYICMWLRKETHSMSQFDSVIFNVCNQFYSVDSSGEVTIVQIELLDHSRALMLLDPCKYLDNAQAVPCAMLIVFTSPSCLVSQPNKPVLSGLSKTSKYYVMDPPSVQVMTSLYGAADARRLETFSWQKDGVRFCSLRWFSFAEEDIPEKLNDCLTELSKDALWDWFTTNSEPTSNDPRLPFCLCIVERGYSSSWIVTGFVSPAVEKYLCEWSMGTGRRTADKIANILQNRMLKDGEGIYFERWLFDKLGEGLELNISESKVKFQGLKVLHESSPESDTGIVYKLDRATFPSIEGYAITGGKIYLLQSTVSPSHSGARYDDVAKIIRAAIVIHGALDILVVYIALSGSPFTVPKCVGFPARTQVVRGLVDDRDFLAGIPSSPSIRDRDLAGAGASPGDAGGGKQAGRAGRAKSVRRPDYSGDSRGLKDPEVPVRKNRRRDISPLAE